MLVDKSQSGMIPLKIVKHPIPVLPRGRIHRPRHKQLSLGRLLVINLSKFHFHLQTLLLHQQNIKKKSILSESQTTSSQACSSQPNTSSKTPTKTSSKPSTTSRSSLPKPSDSNSKHQQKLLLNHQQHLDLACQNHLIQIQNTNTNFF